MTKRECALSCVAAVAIALSFLGCDKQESNKAPSIQESDRPSAAESQATQTQPTVSASEPSRSTGLATSEPVSTQEPIWSRQLINSQTSYGALFTGAITYHKRPPFYKGPMPLTFQQGTLQTSVGPGSLPPRVVFQEFQEFRTDFIYKGPGLEFQGHALGAQTVDRAGHIRAEARCLRMVSNQDNRVVALEIEELHYSSDGKVEFSCEGRISFPEGEKVGEARKTGKKKMEYYFLWPCGAW